MVMVTCPCTALNRNPKIWSGIALAIAGLEQSPLPCGTETSKFGQELLLPSLDQNNPHFPVEQKPQNLVGIFSCPSWTRKILTIWVLPVEQNPKIWSGVAGSSLWSRNPKIWSGFSPALPGPEQPSLIGFSLWNKTPKFGQELLGPPCRAETPKFGQELLWPSWTSKILIIWVLPVEQKPQNLVRIFPCTSWTSTILIPLWTRNLKIWSGVAGSSLWSRNPKIWSGFSPALPGPAQSSLFGFFLWNKTPKFGQELLLPFLEQHNPHNLGSSCGTETPKFGQDFSLPFLDQHNPHNLGSPFVAGTPKFGQEFLGPPCGAETPKFGQEFHDFLREHNHPVCVLGSDFSKTLSIIGIFYLLDSPCSCFGF
ncbi:uncharacterized protein LOC141725234 [Zonotrichia albicollis]|uniref:uncharacterized protein LOC141725234 n=1 Tax=Zonotrichia albicollis TaxID=44394 RepID=UPI003D810AB5